MDKKLCKYVIKLDHVLITSSKTVSWAVNFNEVPEKPLQLFIAPTWELRAFKALVYTEGTVSECVYNGSVNFSMRQSGVDAPSFPDPHRVRSMCRRPPGRPPALAPRPPRRRPPGIDAARASRATHVARGPARRAGTTETTTNKNKLNYKQPRCELTHIRATIISV